MNCQKWQIVVKKMKSFVFLFLISFLLLFFQNIKPLGGLESFEHYDSKSKIEDLRDAWHRGGIQHFLLKKELLRKKLKVIYETPSINPTIKKDVLSIMQFMFPNDIPDRLFKYTMLATRMKRIETFPRQYQARLEYKLLERETYLAFSGSTDADLSYTKTMILKIYKDIAGMTTEKK